MKLARFWLLGVAMLALQQVQGSEPGSGADVVSQLVKEFKAAPPWPAKDEDADGRKAKALLKVIEKAMVLSPEEARRFTSEYSAFIASIDIEEESKREGGLSNWDEQSKLFIFIRAYCNVPEWDNKDALSFRGGWLPCVQVKDQFAIRLPLSVSPTGELELTGDGYSYMGGGYSPVKDFDFLLERYGPRVVKSR